MTTQIPVILVGINEAAGAAGIKQASATFEFVHYVLADAATTEVPLLLSGEKLDESTRSSKLGTNDYSKSIKILLFAPTVPVATIEEVEKVVESQGLDKGIVVSKYDKARPLPAIGTPEFMKEVTDRGQEGFKKWQAEGGKEKVILC